MYVQLENNPTTKNITFQVSFETVNTDQYNSQQVYLLWVFLTHTVYLILQVLV